MTSLSHSACLHKAPIGSNLSVLKDLHCSPGRRLVPALSSWPRAQHRLVHSYNGGHTEHSLEKTDASRSFLKWFTLPLLPPTPQFQTIIVGSRISIYLLCNKNLKRSGLLFFLIYFHQLKRKEGESGACGE